ncbi:MAG: glutamate--tRNA ligase family protein, partial [Deltaproteobacteria bacterium]|nr:glutamate--tRNA ligase family protein [Deltaproteobacteria bacterium]
QDGGVTYHLAVVVDDAAQGVTHVLRGQEHLANTPRHQALQRALNLPRPHYAHLPVIQNPDGSKMSKRDREKGIAVDIEDFRRQGVLPEVLLNFLALLGYSPGEKLPDGRDLERFNREHLLRHFSLARVGRGNARFDRSKLAAFNQDSIAALPPADFKAHWTTWCNRYAEDAWSAQAQKMGEARRALFLQALQPRSKSLADLTALDGPGAFALLKTQEFAYEEKAVSKWLRRGEPSGLERLRELRPLLAELAPFDPESIEAAVAGFCEARGIGLGKAAQPLRVAVTGGASSPPLGITLAILGQTETTARLDRCLAEIGGAQNSA